MTKYEIQQEVVRLKRLASRFVRMAENGTPDSAIHYECAVFCMAEAKHLEEKATRIS